MPADLFVHSNLEILPLRYVFLNKIRTRDSSLNVRDKFQFAAIGFFVEACLFEYRPRTVNSLQDHLSRSRGRVCHDHRQPVGKTSCCPSATDNPTPDQRYAVQTPDRTHRVRRGDTLSGIAARYGTSVHQLVALNKLRSRNRIRIGQVLRHPKAIANSSLAPQDP